MALASISLSRRGLYGLLLFATAAIVMLLVASLPYYWLSAIGGDMDQAQTELRFIEARINAAKGDSRPQLAAGDDIAPLFLTGGTSGLLLADLQTHITSLAVASHMTVIRSQPLQTDRQEDLAVLRVEVEASGNIENLRDFLAALETGEPLAFVNQVQIITQPASQAAEGTLPSENLTAVLQIEAYGWWGSSS
jgi:hypothetical protein